MKKMHYEENTNINTIIIVLWGNCIPESIVIIMKYVLSVFKISCMFLAA